MKTTVEQFVQDRAEVVETVSDDLEKGETQATALDEHLTSVMRALADPSASLDDRLDIALAAARMLTTGPERFTLDEVLAQLGYTREQIAALPD